MAAAKRHLLVALSSHGFGHVAQAAPVINALRRRYPNLQVTVRTSAPRALVASRIAGPLHWQERADDFGLIQSSALDIDLPASAAAYRELHARWPDRVAQTAREIAAVRPDVVLADIPYLTLAAAVQAEIPAIALCSLNWADIYAHYFGRDAIHSEILQAYRQAGRFLRPAPAMPMPELDTIPLGPVFEPVHGQRQVIEARLGLHRSTRLVLVALGGMPARLPMERWPRLPGVRWLVPASWHVSHPDAVPLESLQLPFAELVASVDLLLTKPGYGSFVEAAGCGVPVVYVPRSDWPEEPWLVRWLRQTGHALELGRDQAEAGEVEVVARALERGRSKPIAPEGVAPAAELIADYLRS